MISEKKGLLIIQQEFLDQFELLCRLIPNREWSGLVAYKITGSLTNPESLTVQPQYIHLMDIGTPGTTEYEFGPESVKIFDDFPQVQDMRMGNIHSHHNMAVFFSGTDLSELDENSRHHHIYLSIIVNNRSDVIAKLAMYVESQTIVTKKRSFKITDLDKKEIPSTKDVMQKETEKILYTIDLNVKMPKVKPKSELLQKIVKRFEYMEKNEKKVVKTWGTPVNDSWQRPVNQQNYGRSWEPDIKKPNPVKHYSSPLNLTLRDRELIYEYVVSTFTVDGQNHEKLVNAVNSMNLLYQKADPAERKLLTDSIGTDLMEHSMEYEGFEDQAIAQIIHNLKPYQHLAVVRDVLEVLGIL